MVTMVHHVRSTRPFALWKPEGAQRMEDFSRLIQRRTLTPMSFESMSEKKRFGGEPASDQKSSSAAIT